MAGYLLSQLVLSRFFSGVTLSIIFAVLYILKFKLEGFKITFPLFAIAQIAMLYFSNFFVQALIVGALLFTLNRLPVFRCVQPTGSYRVGYKDLEIEGLDLSVYYPTFDTTRDVLVHEGNVMTKRNYEGARLFFNIYIPYIVPQIIHEIAFSFFWKLRLGVNANASLIPVKREEKLPVILFSHGIACSKNLYTIFTKEWASRGYLVFCVDHDEEIYCNWKYFDDLIDAKKPLLEVRKESVKKLLTCVLNNKVIENLFGPNAQIDTDRIFMAGHSFGGGTATTVAFEDKRITGGLVLLDPFLGPCEEKILQQEINLPIICLRTDEYDRISPIRDTVLKFVKKNSDNILSGYLQDSFHCIQSDLILYLAKELSLWEMNGKLENIEPHIVCHRKLMNTFLDTVCAAEKSQRQNPKTLMKQIKQEINGYLAIIKKRGIVFYNDN